MIPVTYQPCTKSHSDCSTYLIIFYLGYHTELAAEISVGQYTSNLTMWYVEAGYDFHVPFRKGEGSEGDKEVALALSGAPP